LHSLATFSYAKDLSDIARVNASHRPELLVILSKIGHPRYAHFIAKYADSESEEVRLAVAYALGEMKQPSGVPVLRLLLEDSNSAVGWTASNSLVRIAGDRVAETVRLRLHHPRKEIQALAARTLACLGVVEGLSVLRRLASAEEKAGIRSLALAYLGQLKDLESRPTALAGLEDENILVRTYSIYALGNLGEVEDIAAIEASLAGAKRIDPTPADTEALGLIDETVRETLERIRSRHTRRDSALRPSRRFSDLTPQPICV
jgi:HEAT repeat protein